MNSFDVLGLTEPLLRAVREQGYTQPTPIQLQAIPPLLQGRDLLGSAQTGTGKTAAFALPILQKVQLAPRRMRPGRMRVLVVTPTRELAIQIDESFRTYGAHMSVKTAVLFGGVGQQPQVEAMQRGPDVLTATPGRLLDLLNQGHLSFDGIDTFVLDEADRMLDMGFIPDVRRIVAQLPSARHSAFFSATMPPDIAALARTILTDPVHIEVVPESTTADKVVQRVIFVERKGKPELLAQILKDPRVTRTLVFTRTKHGANRVVEQLSKVGIRGAAIHGNKSQGARQRALTSFRSGEIPVLVATDIAARGLDIEEISHVINYELPNIPESYVHRIGRTARAGASGLAISFCDNEEIAYLRDIEQLIGQRVHVAGDRIGLPPEVLDPGTIREGRRAAPVPKGNPKPGNKPAGSPNGGKPKQKQRRRRRPPRRPPQGP